MKQSELAPLSISRWHNRKERLNQSIINVDMDEKAKQPVRK